MAFGAISYLSNPTQLQAVGLNGTPNSKIISSIAQLLR